MRPNKKTLGIIMLVGLFFFTGMAFAADSATITDPLGVGSFDALLGNIVKAVGTIIGGIGTIMFIVSGIMFLASAGNPQKMQTAKTALIYAIIGMVVGLSVNAIVSFVQQSVGG